MKFNARKSAIVFSIIFLAYTNAAIAKLNVVTTTPDLAALVSAVAQDRASVLAIAKGTQDPHQIEAKPSFMIKMRDSDLVIAQGLELESAWLNPLISGSRNPKIASGTNGFLEIGEQLEPIDVPTAQVSRAQGDVHPGGNPHFQLDPVRMGQAAVIIAQRLSALDSKNSEFYLLNAKTFKDNLESKTKEWQSRILKTGLREIVTYHKTLNYFFARFGLNAAAQIEPKPGIPPTASHLMSVIDLMRAKKVRLVLIENYFDDHAGKKITQILPETVVRKVPVTVGGEPQIQSTEQLIENLVNIIESAKSGKNIL